LRHLTGLLKVRGELKKSDVVATSLAIQSLQELILATRRTRIRLVVWWLGKPWENHGKTMGKPWEHGDLCCNNGWLVVWNHGFLNDFPFSCEDYHPN
jgi:hypothetical protein